MRVEDSSVGTQAFGAEVDGLYRRHAGEAMRVARSITHNTEDAADAVADAFAGVLRAFSAGRVGPEAFRPYLLAATRNAAIDIVRRTGRLTPTAHDGTLDGAATSVGPSDRLLAGEDRALVAGAFAELPARWRAVLWLTEVEGLPPRDAAQLLRVTPNNVAQLAGRARGRLRERYVQMHVRNHASGDCEEATEHLGGLVAGQLTTIQANRVRGHLAECAACRERLAELEDMGLSLRRAALPLAGLFHRLRRRLWPWGQGGGHGGQTAAAWVAGVDPAVPAAVAGLGTSPAVQQVAASVAAGLLAIGVGTAVVRQHDSRPNDSGQPAVELAVPGLAPTAAGGPGSEPGGGGAPGEATTTTATTLAPTTTVTTVAADAATGASAAAAPAGGPPPFTPRGRLAEAQLSVVAHATGPQLSVYDLPGASAPTRALANPQPSGSPLAVLVTAQQGSWLQVLLPVRPNGSTGWVRSDQVSLASHNYRIVVELAAHRITAYQGTEVLLSEPIGVGTRTTPTPGGLYYVKELIQPLDRAGNVDADGPYGPYAYGLSGFSDVLFDFAGGDGQFGIHGTNDPSGLGRDVSHGCIRMSNAGITRLAGILPLGTPVEILP